MKTKSRLFFFFYLIGEMYWYTQGQYKYTFICHNTTDYIPKQYFCDGKNFCEDGEDEEIGCKREGNHTCLAGRFSCDGECFNLDVRCNTITECKDGTDEHGCGDEINVKNCTSINKFLCKDGLRCLGIEHTCDGECNCFDCSDENENCSVHDDDLLNKCSHAYFATAKGPRCFCESNDTKSQRLCKSIKMCSYKNYIYHLGKYIHCDQRCVELKRKKQCSCYENYNEVNGTYGSKCKTTKDFLILYTNTSEIKSYNNTSFETSTIARKIDNCTLLTAANNYVYYATLSQNGKGNIFKTSLNNGKPEKLIETEFALTSIAVDYVTNNTYFTGNGTLSVCTSDGKICTQLKCCNVDLVTLAPRSGWMYYMQKQLNHSEKSSCQNKSILIRSNMDGSNETILHDRCFGIDAFMEMDESKNLLNLIVNTKYTFIDFYSLSVDSDFQQYNMDYEILYTSGIRSFSFYNNEMFYTVNEKNDIFYYKYIDSSHYFGVKESLLYFNDPNVSSVADVHVYNAAIQHSIENPCEKSSCTGLCLLRPEENPSMYFLSHICLCDGFIPTDDNHWCSNANDDNHGSLTVVWVIVCILILIILCVTGYVSRKRFWQQCSLLM